MTRMYCGKPALGIAIAAVPWAWSVLFVPPWVSAVSVLLLVPAGGALAVLLRANVRTRGEAAESVEQTRREQGERLSRLHQAMSDVHSHIGRWSRTSRESRAGLRVAQDEVGAVINEIQSAVLDIANRFRSVMAKTGQQMDCALRLLKPAERESSGESSAWQSLLDYLDAYHEQLVHVTEQMAQFSAATCERDAHQRKMYEHMALVDDLIDELRMMARQTSKLALESSVLATSGCNDNRSGVVGLTDRIRAISDQTHDVTGRIRRSLEEIKQHIAVDRKALQNASDIVQKAASQAKSEVAQLNITTLEKMNEVEHIFSRIGELGKEIKADIAKIIVAMQFQDITQQKLERVHQPVLNQVINQLRLVADEAAHVRAEVGSIVTEQTSADRQTQLAAASNARPYGAPSRHDGEALRAASDAEGPAAPAGKGEGNAVELF